MLAAATLLMVTSSLSNFSESAVIEERKPIKLNVKQSLVMKQVLQVYALTDSANDTCKGHSKEFQRALKAFEPWALQMFDSSSKLQSGILSGNLMEYGAFKQCINIKAYTGVGEINGKHCLLKIRPSENIIKKILSFRNITGTRYTNNRNFLIGASLYWAVCIPDSCTYKDVLDHFNETIQVMGEGLDITVSIEEIDCYTQEESTPFNRQEMIVLFFLLIILFINATCTTADIYLQKKNKDVPQIIPIFSVYSNIVYIVSYREEAGRMSCLHGIRFISIFYVLLGHKFLMSVFFPLTNTLDVIQWLATYPSTIITGATVSVDSFFLMSGLLVSYHFFEHVSNGGNFNLLMFYLHRYIRLTPPMAVFILVFATFGHRFGSGPLWNRAYVGVTEPCQYFWWSAISYIQCYVNSKYFCILQSWYLSCDMQYYIASPIILLPLLRSKALGIISFAGLTAASIGLNFYLAYTREYKAWGLIDNQLPVSDYFRNYYILPPARASPYLIGLLFGYFMQKTKDVNYKLNYFVLTTGWILSLGTMCFVTIANHIFYTEHYVYNKLENTFYLSMSRPIWALALAWVIFVCREGYGGPINAILSCRIHQVLGKISYSVFLTHMQVQFFYAGSSKAPLYFSGFNLTLYAFADMVLILWLAFALTVLIEYPFVRISILFFRMGKNRVNGARI